MRLNWTQTEWNEFFARIGIVASLWCFLRRVRDQLKNADIKVDEFNDVGKLTSDWSLSGVKYPPTSVPNTDDNGKIYVRLEYLHMGQTATRHVSLFRDSDRQYLVAYGESDDSGVLIDLLLEERNNSGLSGLVTLQEWDVGHTIEDIYLYPRLGLIRQIQNLPRDDSSLDFFLQVDMNSVLTGIVERLGSGISDVESFISIYLVPYIAARINSVRTLTGGGEESVADGTVSVKLSGIIEDLVDAMNDEKPIEEGGAGPQTILKAIPTNTSLLSDANNGPRIASASDLALYDFARSGMVTLECISETLGAEQFNVSLMGPDGERIAAARRLQVGKVFRSLDIGISQLTLKIENDSGAEADHFSQWFFSGVTSTNTDAGVLYCKYTASTGLLQLYKTKGPPLADLVAHGTRVGDVCDFIPDGDSGLSGSVVITETPGDSSTLVVDMNFKEEDKFYFEITEDLSSAFMTFFGRFFLAELPNAAAGAKTIKNAYADRGFFKEIE
jgi:hypothetical protein